MKCNVDVNDRTITFAFDELITLNPGETISIGMDEFIIIDRKQFEVLMRYYDWRTDGAVLSDVSLPPPQPATKQSFRVRAVNLFYDYVVYAWRPKKTP